MSVLNNETLDDTHEKAFEKAFAKAKTFTWRLPISPNLCKGTMNLPLVTYVSLWSPFNPIPLLCNLVPTTTP
jgi:hypothetical protein